MKKGRSQVQKLLPAEATLEVTPGSGFQGRYWKWWPLPEMSKSQVSLLLPTLLSRFLELYKNVYNQREHIVAGRHVRWLETEQMIQRSHQEGRFICVSCKVLIIRILPYKQQGPELSCRLSCDNTGNLHQRIKTGYKIYFVDMEEAHVFLDISKCFLTLSVKKCLWWVFLFYFSSLECRPCEQSSF